MYGKGKIKVCDLCRWARKDPVCSKIKIYLKGFNSENFLLQWRLI